jgi:hypothetical protein
MKNLKYLNINRLQFSGSQFLYLCRDYFVTYDEKWPLKYLSIEESSEDKPIE